MKMNKTQLVEAIRDTIYEVLEEELDRKIHAKKAQALKESKAKKSGALKARIVAAKKAKLKESKIAAMRKFLKEHDKAATPGRPRKRTRRTRRPARK